MYENPAAQDDPQMMVKLKKNEEALQSQATEFEEPKQEQVETAPQQPETKQPEQQEKPQAAQPQPQQPQQPKAPQGEQPKDQTFPWEEGYDAGDFARNTAEGAASIPVGVVDFAVDLVNHIPGVNIPKLPQFKSEFTQSLRNISAIVVPTIVLSRLGIKGGKLAQAKVGHPIGKSNITRFIGETGISAGAGAFVDYTVESNQYDDNLQGTLKKMFPKHMQWIDDDWATLDSDSPDVKRAKNTNEGVGLGIFSDLLLGSAKLLRAVQKTRGDYNKLIPKSETTAGYKEAPKRAQDAWDDSMTPEDVAEAAGRAREEALDEIGELEVARRKASGKSLDEPILGRNNAFGIEEEGVRSKDPGGAQKLAEDAARIQNNKGTVSGRIGSVSTEAALNKGLAPDNRAARKLIKDLIPGIKNAKEYRDMHPGLTFKMIDDAGTRLSEILLDPRADTGYLKQILKNYKDEMSGVKNLDVIGYSATMKAIKGYMDEYFNLDALKAQAYVTTSLAGQVSDMAEGMRYMDGTAAVERAQELILNRVEYLLTEKGLAAYMKGSSLNFLKTWKRIKSNPKLAKELQFDPKKATDAQLDGFINRNRQFIESLRDVSKRNPEYLKPLMLGWEFTDGEIDSMSKLTNFYEQSLPDILKGVRDNQPEIPNMLVQGMWSNIYNSVLTSISTPAKALFGNSVLLLEKPVATMIGAGIGRDAKAFKRAWYQYSSIWTTTHRGLKHMGHVFSRASRDPQSVGYIMRDDIAIKNQQNMALLKSYAEAAAAQGNQGPMVLYSHAETLNDLGNHPFLRFGANAMTALDGFARSVIATGEARARIYDQFIDGGVELSPKRLQAMENQLYRKSFDENGMITGEAIENASREIAMNLDSKGVQAMGEILEKFPMLRPFMMFPRTSINMLDMANKHSPISVFAREYNDIAVKKFDDFSAEEMQEILRKRGIETGSIHEAQTAFHTLQAEYRGRKAIGALTITSAAALFMNNRLHGNGHYDKERQRVRTELGWKPRTYKGTDGRWYSYDGLGPISDFLALTADVMDNFDSITEVDAENMYRRLGFLLSANITNKSVLSGLEPLFDIISGNPAQANRWLASFSSSFIPLSGMRSELGRLIAPEMREIDMDFRQLLANRNRWLTLFGDSQSLPLKYDWLDGKPVGYPEDFFARLLNAVSPMKVYDDVLSDERKFLVEIEYDSRPSFNKSTNGIEYTPEEREELYQIMGKSQYFKKAVARIMNSERGKNYRREIKEHRRNGKRVDPNLYRNVYNELNSALYTAKKFAETQLSNASEVRKRQFEENTDKIYQRRGKPGYLLENK